MTAIADAKTILQLMAGKTLTATKMLNNVERHIRADPHSLIANGDIVFADPDNPTNEEKAEFFILSGYTWYRKVGQQQMSKERRELNVGTEDTAAAESDADMT